MYFQLRTLQNGTWKRSELDGYNHDLSLLFDEQEDGTHIYMFTGSGSVHVRELQEDADGNITYKDGGLDQTIIENANCGEDINLNAGRRSRLQDQRQILYLYDSVAERRPASGDLLAF